ncbi:MAG: hypothetical protein ACOVOQ_01600 [Flavobacterium sp.]
MKNYDKFTPNILEQEGKIEKKTFKFHADNCKLWHKGNCIADWNSSFQIDAEISPINGNINVKIDISELSEYITNFFSFSEISLFNDRVIWSNNFDKGFGGALNYEPGNMSLFYYHGALSRIYLNVFSPKEIMLELTSNKDGQINQIENPWEKAARDLGFIK